MMLRLVLFTQVQISQFLDSSRCLGRSIPAQPAERYRAGEDNAKKGDKLEGEATLAKEEVKDKTRTEAAEQNAEMWKATADETRVGDDRMFVCNASGTTQAYPKVLGRHTELYLYKPRRFSSS